MIRQAIAITSFRAWDIDCIVKFGAWTQPRLWRSKGLVLEILAQASRRKKAAPERKSPDWLLEATAFLHDSFSESIVFEDLARIVGIHPAYLARVFREKNGCTMAEYVRRLGVEFACRQISATNTPFGEIALAAGFADQSHLNKTFKTLFGLTLPVSKALTHIKVVQKRLVRSSSNE